MTPTGAAIARHLSSRPGMPPRDRRLLGTGLGFGTRVLPGMSNCVRVLAFEGIGAAPHGPHGNLVAIEFEVDDQTPEDLAIGLDHVRAHPDVFDVLQIPAVGKKGRVTVCVRVLCRAEAEREVASRCFFETTTIGLRVSEVRRHVLQRAQDSVEVLGRVVARKQAERGGLVTSKVEAASLREVAGHEERERIRREVLSETSK